MCNRWVDNSNIVMAQHLDVISVPLLTTFVKIFVLTLKKLLFPIRWKVPAWDMKLLTQLLSINLCTSNAIISVHDVRLSRMRWYNCFSNFERDEGDCTIRTHNFSHNCVPLFLLDTRLQTFFEAKCSSPNRNVAVKKTWLIFTPVTKNSADRPLQFVTHYSGTGTVLNLPPHQSKFKKSNSW